jgi:phosphatidate phosphatase APP1
MANWKARAADLFSRVEEPLDTFKLQLKLRHGWLDPLLIQAYRGHGTTTTFYLKGRVLEHTGATRSSSTDSTWKNVLNMYRRFSSDELPGARVRAQVDDATWEVVTDSEGYFTLRLELPTPLDSRRVWNSVKLDLIEPLIEDHRPIRTIGHVLVPPPEAQFAIVSDIDDTVVKTDATNLLRMARMVFLSNAHTRVPFEGVAAFYNALRRGSTGCDHNPIFYVSSSPWNLYDLLVDFLNIQGIPYGPLFLRDFGLDAQLLSSEGHHSHKLEQIKGLLDTYPHLPFVLIGDSGQEDPEIYRQVVGDFPGRIKAIYIRDVTSQERHDEVEAIAQNVHSQGVEMVLVQDTIEAAEHAASHGLIQHDALPKIQAKKEQAEHKPDLFAAKESAEGTAE